MAAYKPNLLADVPSGSDAQGLDGVDKLELQLTLLSDGDGPQPAFGYALAADGSRMFAISGDITPLGGLQFKRRRPSRKPAIESHLAVWLAVEWFRKKGDADPESAAFRMFADKLRGDLDRGNFNRKLKHKSIAALVGNGFVATWRTEEDEGAVLIGPAPSFLPPGYDARVRYPNSDPQCVELLRLAYLWRSKGPRAESCFMWVKVPLAD